MLEICYFASFMYLIFDSPMSVRLPHNNTLANTTITTMKVSDIYTSLIFYNMTTTLVSMGTIVNLLPNFCPVPALAVNNTLTSTLKENR